MPSARTILLTTLTMLAFAGNSVLCRIALRETGIDAASFTTLRLASWAVVLWLTTATDARQLAGLALAVGGLVGLLPGLSVPPFG